MTTHAPLPLAGRRSPASGSPASASDWRRTPAGDGSLLAWRTDGPDTPPDDAGATCPVVLVNGITCDDVWWRPTVPYLTARRQVVRWHFRGHGLSEPSVEPDRVDVSTTAADLLRVMDAAGLRSVALLGHSFGVQVALEAVRLAPARVVALGAVAGAAGRPLGAVAHRAALHVVTALPVSLPGVTAGLWRAVWAGERVYWPARLLRGIGTETPRWVQADYFAHVLRTDPATLAPLLRVMQAHDASELLGTLDIPLVAVAGSADGLVGVDQLRAAVLRAPDAELVVMRGASHTLPSERPAALAEALEPLLVRADAACAAAPGAAPAAGPATGASAVAAPS